MIRRPRSLMIARVNVDPILAAAEEAFARADYVNCERLLDLTGHQPSTRGRAELLRAKIARIAIRIQAWHDAAAVAARSLHDDEGRLSALALEVAALEKLGRRDEASAKLDRLQRQIAQASPSEAAYATYLLALRAWETGDYDGAETLAQRNVKLHPGDAESAALLGWIEVKRERFRAAGAQFMRALDALEQSEIVDLRLQGRLIHAAGIVASETIDLDMGRRVRNEFEAMPWPAALAIERFNAVTCLRFLSLLEGDVNGAWLASRDAAGSAPPGAYAAIAETNAAGASILIGDQAGARIELERAWEILRSGKWGAADDEARVALSNFAIVGARQMPAEARKAITLYQSLAAKANTLNALHRDRRVRAFEAMAAARVSEVIGQRDLAIEHYRRSLDQWQELGFAARAALVALDLRRMTGERGLTKIVKAALELAPNAWFRERLAAKSDPVERLTPAERAVLAELLSGKSAKAIARGLGRSPYTVINHTRSIYAAFGVRSRPKLLVRCAELRISAEQLGAAPLANATSAHRPRSSPERR